MDKQTAVFIFKNMGSPHIADIEKARALDIMAVSSMQNINREQLEAAIIWVHETFDLVDALEV